MTRIIISLLLVVLTGPAAAAQNLFETYQQALRHDTELAAAQAELGAARARYQQAHGQLLPHLSLSASYNQVTRDVPARHTSGDSTAVTLNLSQSLFDWSAWQKMDAAAARSDQARVLLSAARQALIVRTTQAYFNVLAARDTLHATRERQKAIRRQVDRARAAFQAGLAPITDKQEAQSSLDAARVDAIAAQNRLANARQQLRVLTGRPLQRLAGIATHEPTTLGGTKQRSRQAWLKLAMQHASALDAARAALRAAQQQVAAARGRRYPDIALVGRVGRNAQLSRFANTSDTVETWSIGLQLEMPLFSGGVISGAVNEAAAKARQARLESIAARRQLRLDIGSAWRNARSAADRVAALDQAIKSARTAVRAARAGYRLGNRTILDVIEAETELVQRKAQRKQAWYDYALARLKLRQAAGVLGHMALTRLSKRLAPPDNSAGSAADTSS